MGPLTRTVGDAARLMTVLAGPDPADPATALIPSDLDLDFEAPLEGATLRGKRLGVFEVAVGTDVQALFDAERARLEAAGAITVDIAIDPPNFWADEYTVLTFEFKAGINDYLASHPGTPATLAGAVVDSWPISRSPSRPPRHVHATNRVAGSRSTEGPILPSAKPSATQRASHRSARARSIDATPPKRQSAPATTSTSDKHPSPRFRGPARPAKMSPST